MPVLASLVALIGIFLWGGWGMLFTAALLSVLEITLSFDNAILNAKILAGMDEKWRRRFITWGILVAVFGTRLVLPVLIVSFSALVSPLVIANLALFDPGEYGRLLEEAHYAIGAFGGIFLTMVALKYFFNQAKEVHWIEAIEERLSSLGRLEAIEIMLALVVLLVISFFVGHEAGYTVLFAGLIGIILFIVIHGVANTYASEGAVAGGSAALFVYLNVLDSAFSLDGVIGAFAITSVLPIIVVGLGIGAYFVRAITLYLVERNTLNTLLYLEHGAHWAIFGLALAMLAGLLIHVPEVITGVVGFIIVVAAYVSSVRYKRRTDGASAL